MDTTSERLPAWAAITIVFLSNFCILVLELVAGRMMAPIVGVSLYTWTSIIGVILAGISLGNYLGGRIADRWASRRVLAWFFMLSALATVTILGNVMWVDRIGSWNLPTVLKVLLVFTIVFMLPATILGTISPIVVKLTLADLSQTGRVVGLISAAGTLGSIVGTFMTGFFLISTFGTRLIVWGVAGCLLLIGAALGLSSRGKTTMVAVGMVLLFIVSSVVMQSQGWLTNNCLRETDYFCIKVRTDSDNKNVRVLTLDRLVHSYVDLTDPTYLRYDYEKIYADVVATLFPHEPPIEPHLAALFIGGGGYTFPRYLEAKYADSHIEVVEIDPGVTAVAYEKLGLSLDTTIISHNGDARQFIHELAASAKYDLIVGDAFNDFSVPYHLTTQQFNQLVAAHLTPQGIYMVNIIDGRQGDFMRAYVNTLRQTLPHVYLAAGGEELGSKKRQTLVIVASANSLDDLMGELPLKTQFLSQTKLDNYLQQKSLIIMTDDYVPVDNLLAPVFAESGF